MKRRLLLAFLFAAVAIAMSAGAGGSFAAPFSKMAPALLSSNASALTKVQYACGWTYSCTNLGNESSGSRPIQIYGPVNVYTGADVKPEIWRVPEGAWAWTGQDNQDNQDNQDSQTWRGWGCGGYPCDEKCGAFCWFNRVRNGYCGHGCDMYRQHVMFQPINGNIRPYVYRKTPDCDYGYGPPDGYGYGSGNGLGPCRYGYATGGGYNQASSVQEVSGGGYSQTSSVQEGYYPPLNGAGGLPPSGYPQNVPPPGYPQNAPPAGYPQNAPQGGPYGGPAPAPGGERFVDRLRRFFYGGQPYRDTAANGTVQFERPSNDLVPLRRFNGPKYPPTCNGKNC